MLIDTLQNRHSSHPAWHQPHPKPIVPGHNDSPCGAIPLRFIVALRKPSLLPAFCPNVQTSALRIPLKPKHLRDDTPAGGMGALAVADGGCRRITARPRCAPHHSLASFRASRCKPVRARWYAVYLTRVGGECSWLVSECFSETNFVLHREIVPDVGGIGLAY
jgi:hypothetical protein